jgi:Leucine-rich repeat (LRR) protein
VRKREISFGKLFSAPTAFTPEPVWRRVTGMKQVLLLCAMVMGQSDQSVLAADEKLIADPIVEKAIRRQIGKPKGGLTKVDLAKVTMLALRSTKITDAGLKEIAKLQKLEILNLSDTKITDAGLKEIAKLQKLEILYLNFTKITDAGLKDIVKLQQLTHLSLRYTKITDAGLKEIAKLQELTGLWLNGTDITDAGLMDAAKLQKLIHLNLDGTKITDEIAAELGKALPNCKIFHSYKKDEPTPLILLPLLLPPSKQDGLNRKRSNGFA